MNQVFRNLIFVINNPEESDKEDLANLDWSYLIYQLEMGDDGTPHYQGYMEFDGQKRFGYLKKRLPRAHIEKRMGSQKQAIDYCSKEDTRLEGPFEFGTKKEQGKSSEYLEAIEAAKLGASEKELAIEYTGTYIRYYKGLNRVRKFIAEQRDKPTDVIWLWGPTGCGKTRFAYDNYQNIYSKPAGGWFDGYDEHETVLLDDFEAVDIEISMLLKLLDRYPMSVPVKGGFVNWNPETVIITSNYAPKEWFNRKFRGNAHQQAFLRRINETYSEKCFKRVGNTSPPLKIEDIEDDGMGVGESKG